jgi:PiT family inorganic phosphate transporter
MPPGTYRRGFRSGNRRHRTGKTKSVLVFSLILAALVLAYANGSNDNFKAVATLYGSGTMGYRTALHLATGAQIAGSLASVILAETLLKAFSGKGLVPAEVLSDPVFLTSVGVGAAASVLLATRLGLPVSTTHALVGGLVGAGVALNGTVAWGALGAIFFLPLLISPLLAFVAAAALYPTAHEIRKWLGIEADTCLCVGTSATPVVVEADGALVLRSTGVVVQVGDGDRCRAVYTGSIAGVSVQQLVEGAHTVSGAALGFARGMNDTPKVLGLLVAAGSFGMPPRISLVLISAAMAVGGLLHSARVAETLGHKVTQLEHGPGLTANVVASALVIGASLLGSPVSTTHVSTGAIFGIGTWSGRRSWRWVGGILLAWVGTLPIGALAAGIAAVGLRLLVG